MPVQVQILGGDPGRMAKSAQTAVKAGVRAIDINFGCPAPTVNRHDGGASLLREPCRIREIVRAVREAVPLEIPVSAKLRLGWDSIDAIHENAAMAAEGGASWLTIHARTRVQGYLPPVYWQPIGQVRSDLRIPVIANGDIWTIEDFRQCREETGCIHFMIGRSALANPKLTHEIAYELGLPHKQNSLKEWVPILREFLTYLEPHDPKMPHRRLMRLKQWMKLANNFGDFTKFDEIKHATTVEEFFSFLESALGQ
jgi:tRNA-dihydrouridine synthase C